ncbi:helix-turn-helix domain-containing protein [Neobacillus vireti]|uniref:helix-turn-helix domain-containing protein n=1 Tax=Neobacillus vireti TaxID=220686 RepID=UPI002FFE857F
MKEHEISSIGELIVQKRRALKMSQDELAFNCKKTRKAISNIETGKSLPSLPVFEKIAQALGMDGSELYKEIEDLGMDGSELYKEIEDLGLIDDLFRYEKDE